MFVVLWRRRGFSSLLAVWCSVWVALPLQLPVLHANPSGGSVQSGSANISSGPGGVTVQQSSDRAVVNWGSFSINQGETTTFVQPGAKSAVLNRVTGGSVSQLNGTLNGNGQVYLVNKNGVVIGKSGRVNTAGFTASTHDVSNGEFMTGGDMTFKGDSTAKVQNFGKIRATDGDVTLIAREVENNGRISAKKGTVSLAGGTEVLVKPSGTTGDQRVFIKGGTGTVSNTGSIRATAAELRAAGGNEYALAVNNSGVIRATGVDRSGGRIVLKAEGTDGKTSGMVRNSGKLIAKAKAPGKNGGSVVVTGERVNLATSSFIDASGAPAQAGVPGSGGNGGTVNIGGGFQGKDASVANARVTVADEGSQIIADGGNKGGNVVVWSDEATGFYGSISAKGAPSQTTQPAALSPDANTGPGGFVEVSGKNYLDFRGTVDTGGGTLLLDPSNITIDQVAGNVNLTSSSPFTSLGGADSVLDIDVLQTALASGSVIIQTSGSLNATNGLQTTITGDNASGDIAVLTPISWSSNFSLSLYAHDDIIARSDITSNGFGGLILVAGWGGNYTNLTNILTFNDYGYNGNLQNSGGPVANNGGSVFIGNPTQSVNVGTSIGNLYVLGYDIVVQGGTTTGAFAQLGRVQSASANMNLDLKGSLLVQGGSGNDSYALVGIGGNTPSVSSIFGDIIVQGTGSTASNVAVHSGAGARSYAAIGHTGLAQTSSSIGGSITIQGNIGTVSLIASASNSWAQIGSGGGYYQGGDISGNIRISGNILDMGSSAGVGSWRMIGHGGGNATIAGIDRKVSAANSNFSGDITLNFASSLALASGGSNFATAQIGHGGLGGSYRTLQGNIDITTPVLDMRSPAGGAYVQIGHGGYTGDAFSITAAQSTISIHQVGSIRMSGGSAGSASYVQIGHGGATFNYRDTSTTAGAAISPSICSPRAAALLICEGAPARTVTRSLGTAAMWTQ